MLDLQKLAASQEQELQLLRQLLKESALVLQVKERAIETALMRQEGEGISISGADKVRARSKRRPFCLKMQGKLQRCTSESLTRSAVRQSGASAREALIKTASTTRASKSDMI